MDDRQSALKVTKKTKISTSVADPDPSFHFDAEPDPSYYFDADLDPAWHFDADPEHTFHFDADPNPDPDPSFQVKAQTLKVL